MRTSKLQLAAEQPSTGEYWNPPQKDTPHPREKEKPQEDGRRGEITFRIKFHTCQRCSEGSDKTLGAPGPRDPTEPEPDLPLSVWVSPAEACHGVSGSGCSRPGSRPHCGWILYQPSHREALSTHLFSYTSLPAVPNCLKLSFTALFVLLTHFFLYPELLSFFKTQPESHTSEVVSPLTLHLHPQLMVWYTTVRWASPRQ